MQNTIIELTRNDIDKIISFEHSYAPEMPVYYPNDRQSLEESFNAEGSRKYGIFNGNEMLAYSGYTKTAPGVYMMDGLVVNPTHRRHGLGQLLFDYRLNEIKKDPELKKIYVTCYPQNRPIIMMYLKNNFNIYDLKKDYYGPGADRLFLQMTF